MLSLSGVTFFFFSLPLSASFFVSVSSFFCFFGDIAFSLYHYRVFSLLYGEYVVRFPSGWCFSAL